MDITLGDFANPKVINLLRTHLDGMHANSPPGHVFALDLSGLKRADVAFWTAWEGDELLGCGALKEITPNAGEIKSMRTDPKHLREGVAAAILEHIIEAAKRRRYKRLSIETGTGEAFEPALALYRKRGFKESGAFGGYVKSDFNQFLALEL